MFIEIEMHIFVKRKTIIADCQVGERKNKKKLYKPVKYCMKICAHGYFSAWTLNVILSIEPSNIGSKWANNVLHFDMCITSD